MAGFDAAWKEGKVLVCSAVGRQTVQVWAWMTHLPDLEKHAAFIRRETGLPTWVERYGEPAAMPESPRTMAEHWRREANGKESER